MKDLKIKVNNEAESKEVQELLFELGYTWSGDSKDIFDFDMPEYIVNWNNGYLTVGDHFDENRKEITIAELRAMVNHHQDEPFLTPECTLNDQYAEIEQVRQSLKDNVNHPGHYTQGKVECIDALESATIGKSGIEAVCVANIIKYLWRYEEKNGLEDIKKANFYLNRLITTLENNNG